MTPSGRTMLGVSDGVAAIDAATSARIASVVFLSFYDAAPSRYPSMYPSAYPCS